MTEAARAASTAEARAVLAHAPLETLGSAIEVLSAERSAAVAELRAAGWTWQQIGDLLGLHRNRAAHLLDP